MTTSTPFKDLLHAVNLRHGTGGFTSPPKEGVLRIFSPLKIRRLRPDLNPRNWVLKASMLPLDHTHTHTHTHTYIYIYIYLYIQHPTGKGWKICTMFKYKSSSLLFYCSRYMDNILQVISCICNHLQNCGKLGPTINGSNYISNITHRLKYLVRTTPVCILPSTAIGWNPGLRNS